MPDLSLIILGAKSPERSRLEELLSQQNWRCLIAESPSEVLSFAGWQECQVVLIDQPNNLSQEVVELISKSPFVQVVLYSAKSAEASFDSAIGQKVFALLNVADSSDAQIVLSVAKAAEFAKVLA